MHTSTYPASRVASRGQPVPLPPGLTAPPAPGPPGRPRPGGEARPVGRRPRPRGAGRRPPTPRSRRGREPDPAGDREPAPVRLPQRRLVVDPDHHVRPPRPERPRCRAGCRTPGPPGPGRRRHRDPPERLPAPRVGHLEEVAPEIDRVDRVVDPPVGPVSRAPGRSSASTARTRRPPGGANGPARRPIPSAIHRSHSLGRPQPLVRAAGGHEHHPASSARTAVSRREHPWARWTRRRVRAPSDSGCPRRRRAPSSAAASSTRAELGDQWPVVRGRRGRYSVHAADLPQTAPARLP